MKLSEAIAQDLPIEMQFNDEPGRYAVAWLWELKDGGIAFCFAGYGMSPSAESHLHRGPVEGEGPWTVTDRDRTNEDDTPLIVTLWPARRHVPERGTEEEALRYFLWWHQKLTEDDVLAGTRQARENPRNAR
jgi:hypothetical protein